MPTDNLSPAEIHILQAFGGNDEWCYPYAYFEGGGYDRKQLKVAMTKLRERGFVYYARGLMTEEGEVAGSGFGLKYDNWKEREAAIEASLAADGWGPFTDDYEKQFYSVMLPDGLVLKNGWPNAGKMHVGGQTFLADDESIRVRPQPDFEEET